MKQNIIFRRVDALERYLSVLSIEGLKNDTLINYTPFLHND